MTLATQSAAALLGDLTTLISSGSTPKGGSEVYLREGPVMLIRSQNVRMNELVLDDVAHVTDAIDSQMVRSRVERGDVLLNITGASIGRVAPFNLEGVRANVNQHVCIIRPRPEALFSRYLSYFISSPEFQLHIDRLQHGGTRQALTFSQIADFRIPLPPLPEQRRIAAILDKADELRAKRKTALKQLNRVAQAIFLDMFGDVAKNDRHWASERLGELVTIRRGGSPRPIEKYLGGDINWIKIGDGTQGSDIYLEHCADKITEQGLSKTVFLKAGSLIFANCGVSLGFARILKVDGCIHDGWLSFENVPEDRLDKLFLLKALNSITQHFRTIAPSGTQPNLNTGLMKDFRMILPPIDLQRQFAGEVLLLEEAKSTYRWSLANFDALFASLQHQGFAGAL